MPGVRLRFESNASRPSKTPCILPVRSACGGPNRHLRSELGACKKAEYARGARPASARGILGPSGHRLCSQSPRFLTEATCISHEN
jgi:hypothetical protein